MRAQDPQSLGLGGPRAGLEPHVLQQEATEQRAGAEQKGQGAREDDDHVKQEPEAVVSCGKKGVAGRAEGGTGCWEAQAKLGTWGVLYEWC